MRLHWIYFLCLILLSGACKAVFNQPMETRPARVGEITRMAGAFNQLPKPKEKVVAAVYKFRDQTGQYKPSDNGASWSTVVTQGTTSILLKALEDSGWFIPIERENVSNLLNERKIIRSNRALYNPNLPEDKLLPPMLYAGILLEGGVISYDANIISGGAGIRYFGAGASGQYRQDRVSIYLRAVSSQSGAILKTVYVSKTLLSQAIDVGVFRYVSFKRLLEAETGIAYNEPTDLAITEAIQKAVQLLILEGIIDQVWTPASGDSVKALRMLQDYQVEKQYMNNTDVLKRTPTLNRGQWFFGTGAQAFQINGDYPQPLWTNGISITAGYSTTRQSFAIESGWGNTSVQKYWRSEFFSLDARWTRRFLPYDKIAPAFGLGAGALMPLQQTNDELEGRWFPKIHAHFQLTYLPASRWEIFAQVDQHFLLTDDWDGIVQGRFRDMYFRTGIGVNYYFGRQQPKVKPLSDQSQKNAANKKAPTKKLSQ